jgi:hypothetical protein
MKPEPTENCNCCFCEYYRKERAVSKSDSVMDSTDLALEIINHAATMGCKCQSTGPDVDKNKHWPLCIVGKAQIYLGQKVSIQGGL